MTAPAPDHRLVFATAAIVHQLAPRFGDDLRPSALKDVVLSREHWSHVVAALQERQAGAASPTGGTGDSP